jgi:hypothetical protein
VLYAVDVRKGARNQISHVAPWVPGWSRLLGANLVSFCARAQERSILEPRALGPRSKADSTVRNRREPPRTDDCA